MKLALEDVYCTYPGSKIPALRGVSIELEGGRVYLITGPNGAGKSTLLLVAAGLLKPQRGRVTLNGEVLSSKHRCLIGVLFQNPDLMLFNPTVYDEIAFSLRQLLNSEEDVKRRVYEILRRFGFDEEFSQRRIHELSYGLKKVVAFMSIAVYEPKILLLDEPHTNLQRAFFEKILDYVRNVKVSGGITAIATHNTRLYSDIADCRIKLDGGEVKDVKCRT